MEAALAAATQGFQVYLVEREKNLGRGKAAPCTVQG